MLRGQVNVCRVNAHGLLQIEYEQASRVGTAHQMSKLIIQLVGSAHPTV
jgi:hypothetical protein